MSTVLFDIPWLMGWTGSPCSDLLDLWVWKGTERRLQAPSRWAGSDTRPRGAHLPPPAPGLANTGPEATRFAAQQLRAASVLRKPPCCRPHAGPSDARAVIVFFTSISAPVQGSQHGAEHHRDAWEKGRGRLGEGTGPPAPEVGTTCCRREENPLCSSSHMF